MAQAARLVQARRVARLSALPSVFAAMFALGLAFSTRLFNTWDETWFLQVVARMRDGDVLYRDIAYGAGPLPAYLTAAATFVASVDILAVKLMVVAAFAASATLAWLIAAELGIEIGGRLLILAALAFFGPPLQEPPYGALATTFLLAAMLAALVVRRGGSTTAAVAGGVACGLAFCSKQNVGLYVLLALVAPLLLGRRFAATAAAVLSSVLAVCAVLLPVILSGGFSRYVDYGFTGKGAYLSGPRPFAATLTGVTQTLTDVHSLAGAEAAYWAVGFFLPAFALGALFALRRSNAAATLVLFGLAAAASLFPRFDTVHVAYAAPPLVLLVAYALHEQRSRLPVAAVVAVGAWLGISVVLMTTLPLRLARSSSTERSSLPHLRGSFVDVGSERLLRQENRRLVEQAAGDKRLLLLMPDAAFRYLTTGLRNPTPFDFPLASTFGRTGQQRVIADIAAGRIRRVCLTNGWWGWPPRQLAHFVRTTMRPGAELGLCRMYSRR